MGGSSKGSGAADGEVVAAVADVAQVDQLDLGPGQQLADDGQGVLAVGDQDAVGDPALAVVGADDLLAVAQRRRVLVRGDVAVAGLGVDEYRAALGVGAVVLGGV